MLKTALNLIFLFNIFTFNILIGQKNQDWILKNNKDGVKVYYRKTTDVHEVKLTSSIETRMSGIIQLFSEVENYPHWGYRIVESKLLKKISDREQYYYAKIDFPWPLSDRDLIMHTFLEQDSTTKIITAKSKATPGFLPENKDIVRIKTCNTTWKLHPGTSGWMYIEYFIYSNPGGNIPDWAINLGIDVGPRETIKNIRDILKKDKYTKAKIPYIKD
jgi:hypothetical protein